MCYYYGRIVSKEEYNRLVELEKAVAFLSQDQVIYKGFDYNFVDIIRAVPGTHRTETVKMQWGFLPPYLKNMDEVNRFRNGYRNEATGKWIPGYTTLNATSENLMERIYADAALHRRGLFPMNWFHEWQHVQVVGKRGKILKTPERFPYKIEMIDEPQFYVAAVWQPWTNRDTGETINTVAMVTAPANQLMKQIHNTKERMPTVLPGDLAEAWLYHDLTLQQVMDIANYQVAASAMRAIPLDKEFLKKGIPHTQVIYEENTLRVVA